VGPVGPTGSPGAAGPTGATGAKGATGPGGKVELVSCKTETKTVKGKKKTQQVCTTKVVSSVVKFTSSGAVRSASLSRGHVVYATGRGQRSAKRTTRLLLRPLRRLTKGSYTLKIGSSPRETVTVS
jgi:hypothetical protein